MAKLTEIDQFTEEVYQLEVTDFVEGGENGVDNKPHKALANRTKWLKAKIDSFLAGTGLTKAMVGLGSVDNTADLAKPINTATQTALNAKEPTITVLPIAKGGTGRNDGKAVALATPRNINGVPFDGSADITIHENKKIYELNCNDSGIANITIPMGLGRDTILLADILITARASASQGWAFWKGEYLFNFAGQESKMFSPFQVVEEGYYSDIISVVVTRPEFWSNQTKFTITTNQANKPLYLCIIEKIITIQGDFQ